MRTQCIIGLGYGDEGKGATTATLVSKAERALVIRFSGGHQAGHTVIAPDGRRHVFSNFGAGTLAGAPTYWSRYCTFHPVGYANERAALLELGVDPLLYVDGLCPVTTPYDLLYNRQRETEVRHGSCGLGFGATVARHEGPHKLHVMDLYDDFVLEQKLRSVKAHYSGMGAEFDAGGLGKALDDFQRAVDIVRGSVRCTCGPALFDGIEKLHDAAIFEGSQGLLLDQEFGYFPNVTRAYTSSRNALALCREYGLPLPEIHYVTRCYQTRHGNGPLTNEDREPPQLRPTPEETNVYNPWQGEQRRSLLDVDQLRYALDCDAHYSYGCEHRLVVTCLDQLTGEWRATEGGEGVGLTTVGDLARRLGLYEAASGSAVPRALRARG